MLLRNMRIMNDECKESSYHMSCENDIVLTVESTS